MVLITAANDRAHVRIDTIQREIKDELKQIHDDLKLLLADMHTKKGSKATVVWITGLLVALIAALAKILVH